MTRFLIVVALVASLGWSIWWLIVSSAQETGLKAWLAGREDAGWVAQYSELSVAGFPNRVDTSLTDLELADPTSGWAWSAPMFQILSLSYQPNHVIAVWPQTQKVSTPNTMLDITSERMRGSLVFEADTDLALSRLRMELLDTRFEGQSRSSALASANLATEAVNDGSAPDFAHAIGLDINALAIAPELLARWDRSGVLPQNLERAHFDLIAAFDAPWDRHAVEGRKPQLTALRVRDIDITWGALQLSAQGSVTVDAAGYPTGEINLRAVNWQDMVDVIAEFGALTPDMVRTIKRGLGLIARLSGSPKTIKVPLSFANAGMSIGPVPIGPAPRLIIR